MAKHPEVKNLSMTIVTSHRY